MALIGRVRAYKVDKDDPPDPAKQDDMPDPEFDVRLYGMNHEINVPIKPEDIAPVQGAQNMPVVIRTLVQEESIKWQEYVLRSDTADWLMVTLDWKGLGVEEAFEEDQQAFAKQNNDTIVLTNYIGYMVSLVGVQVISIKTIMPDNLVTDESAHTRIYNEVTLRYEKIQHFSGPTLNKIATSTWFSQRESGAGGGS